MKLEIELDSVYGYKLDDIITEITHRGIHGVTREELAGALLTNIVGLYWDYATKKNVPAREYALANLCDGLKTNHFFKDLEAGKFNGGYRVFWIGAPRDGDTLATADTEEEAVMRALEATLEHKGEFDPVCGGVGIEDPDGHIVEW